MDGWVDRWVERGREERNKKERKEKERREREAGKEQKRKERNEKEGKGEGGWTKFRNEWMNGCREEWRERVRKEGSNQGTLYREWFFKPWVNLIAHQQKLQCLSKS